MWDSLLDAFGRLLAMFYSVIPSYGVAIVLLTVAVRLVLYPLTAKQARSMAAMQRVQPEIKKIQQKYKHDRQKLNEELMAFYKEHQINPLSGCLPLVAQMPIFIALFSVLRNPAKHTPDGSSLFRAFCNGATPAECEPRGLEFLGMDLSKNAGNVGGGFVDALPFLILIGLVIASGYLQSKQMQSLQKGRATNPQAQMMTRIMPVFFGLISYTLPAGVVVYFLTSNVWQIGQQAMVFGREGGAEAGGKAGKAGKPAKDGGTQAGRRSGGSESAAEAVDVESVDVESVDVGDESSATSGKNGGQRARQQPAKPAKATAKRPSQHSRSKKKKKKKRRR